MTQHHPIQQQRTGNRSVANNTGRGGISMPAVPVVQKVGSKLTFTEMSIHSPGNASTIAEVTLDGVSIGKWKNTLDEHAEVKLVRDLEGTHAAALRKAHVLSLTINRAPCKPCAERLVQLKNKYKIEIRVKSTFIPPAAEAGVAYLKEHNVPFRLFTIEQRERLVPGHRFRTKRKWKGKKFTEAARVAKIRNERDLKDLKTTEGRARAEAAYIEKARVAGYDNPAADWRTLGQTRAALTELARQRRQEAAAREAEEEEPDELPLRMSGKRPGAPLVTSKYFSKSREEAPVPFRPFKKQRLAYASPSPEKKDKEKEEEAEG